MSKQIDLKDAKAGMWVEFGMEAWTSNDGTDFPSGSFKGELVNKDTFTVFFSGAEYFGVDGKTVSDTINHDSFLKLFFVDTKSGKVVMNRHVSRIRLYESKPEAATEDDGERITDITKVTVKDTVVLKSGNRYTAVNVRPYCEDGQTLYLRAEEFGALDGWWAYDDDFQYAVHRTFDKFGWPLRTGFYKDNAAQVWHFDAKQNNLMRVLTDDGSPAQSTQSPVYGYGRFKRLADKQNLWPLTETSLVEAL